MKNAPARTRTRGPVAAARGRACGGGAKKPPLYRAAASERGIGKPRSVHRSPVTSGSLLGVRVGEASEFTDAALHQWLVKRTRGGDFDEAMAAYASQLPPHELELSPGLRSVAGHVAASGGMGVESDVLGLALAYVFPTPLDEVDREFEQEVFQALLSNFCDE